MIFDTDVLIWFLRGNTPAAAAVDHADRRAISIVTFMELIQGAKNKREIKLIKRYLADFQFHTLPLSENIGHRASIYMEEYALSAGISLPDALIAATAMEHQESIVTANGKHYGVIKDLDLKLFRPM